MLFPGAVATMDAGINGEDDTMEQIRRIAQMETYLDEIAAAQAEFSAVLEKYGALQEKLTALAAYYESPVWMRDFTDDEAGKLPRELKRGVLSEDAVYDVLTEHGRLRQEMLALCAGGDEEQELSAAETDTSAETILP